MNLAPFETMNVQFELSLIHCVLPPIPTLHVALSSISRRLPGLEPATSVQNGPFFQTKSDKVKTESAPLRRTRLPRRMNG